MPIYIFSFDIGIATNVKLLLKLIEDHNGSHTRDNDMRKFQRVNGMISILDEVRSRIQRFQSNTNRRAEFRRSNSDIKSSIVIPKDKRLPDLITDEKERLRRELQSSLVARQSLQAMCSSLGKEKQIMASELARKAQELTEMEELVSDQKEQNEMLMKKLQACNSEHKEKSSGLEMEGNIALQERNKTLTEQLQKSLDGYKSLKRKFRDTQEENREIHAAMEQMEVEVQAGIDRICGLNAEKITTNEETKNIKEEISALEQMLESLHMKISKHTHKKT